MKTIEATIEEERRREDDARSAQLESNLRNYRDCLVKQKSFIPIGQSWLDLKRTKSETVNHSLSEFKITGAIARLEYSLVSMQSSQRFDQEALVRIDKEIKNYNDKPRAHTASVDDESSLQAPNDSARWLADMIVPRKVTKSGSRSLEDALEQRARLLARIEEGQMKISSLRKEIHSLQLGIEKNKGILLKHDRLIAAMGLGKDPSDLQVKIRMECKPNQFNVQDYVPTK